VEFALDVMAEFRLDKIGIVVANDARRSSFTVGAGDSVLALDANLAVLGRWPGQPGTRGWHATSPCQGLALISANDEVRLLDRAGRLLWRHQHAPWSGALESGCTWFDQFGQPHAVIPATSHDRCLVARFDLRSGQLLAEAAIDAAPVAVNPVHHPDGWVGLSVGEGQDAAKTWWVRPSNQAHEHGNIELLDAGWDNWVLSDVDTSGRSVITTPHAEGPLLVRSFPGLDIVRSIDPPDDAEWDFTACFAGDLLVNKLLDSRERMVAVK